MNSTVLGLLAIFGMLVGIYVILDFEFPRVGLIRLNFFDQALVDVRQSMNP